MALIFEGSSKCAICGKVLNKEKAYTGFAPLTSNMKDSLFLFSDAGMHVDCLDQHPLGQLALFFRNMYDESFEPEKNRCIADGQIIADPRNVIHFGLLSSDVTAEISKLNYLRLNKLNIAKWDKREEFIQVAMKFIADGKWEGFMGSNNLARLINELKTE
jgi:hypothetical protein